MPDCEVKSLSQISNLEVRNNLKVNWYTIYRSQVLLRTQSFSENKTMGRVESHRNIGHLVKRDTVHRKVSSHIRNRQQHPFENMRFQKDLTTAHNPV